MVKFVKFRIFFVVVLFRLVRIEFCMRHSLTHYKNWKTSNKQSIKANTLSIYSMKSIMAAILQTHCHMFASIRSKSVPLALQCLRRDITLRSRYTLNSIQWIRSLYVNIIQTYQTYTMEMKEKKITNSYFIRFTYSVVMAMSKASNN